ncbi:MAG: ABC transporter ATP-binding protein [Rhodomicrobium sp.]
MIAARNLTRNYGTFTAVDNVSFAIGDGEIVGLLGHNGAGKTTIMKMLTGFLEPTAGRVTINGCDIEKDRSRAQAFVGYLPENCPLYPEMTVAAFLDYAAELKGIANGEKAGAIKEAIAATELGEKIMAPISSLSRGYRQRVGVAQAILHNPKIVILDEPTNGLDPSQIKHMRALIKRLAQNATVILSTHILQEVAAVCARVIIVNRGKVALDSPLADLSGGSCLRLVTDGKPEAVLPMISALNVAKGVEALPAEGNGSVYGLTLNGHAADEAASRVARAIADNGLSLYALHPVSRDLETAFAEITAGAEAQEVAHA